MIAEGCGRETKNERRVLLQRPRRENHFTDYAAVGLGDQPPRIIPVSYGHTAFHESKN